MENFAQLARILQEHSDVPPGAQVVSFTEEETGTLETESIEAFLKELAEELKRTLPRPGTGKTP